ncbi:MAG TPA: bifunctional adenosylcobinamide kinase/adenosylcobinamide-phosphate guanylyltransferase [Candidatus Angelobacter sp.]|nr:bifunctional adenosylcobinamide kinase/adenosylcobinamide-phosphate guanylyltransferase [Candidatus Angelobacter sp.]
MSKQQKSVTLVLGGARSGKSTFAQKYASSWANVIFLATAQAVDDEMRDRINRHRRDRPAEWPTVEVPVDLDLAIAQHGEADSLLLVDCLTLYASNIMELERQDEEKIAQRVQRLCATLQSVASSVVLVSNEVGSSVVPAFPAGRFFRDLQGRVNQQVAQVADNVLLMVAGLPLVLKGSAEAPK